MRHRATRGRARTPALTSEPFRPHRGTNRSVHRTCLTPLLPGGPVAILVLVTLGSAHADDDDAPHVIAGVGLAVPVVNRTRYDPGPRVRAGADLRIGAGGTQRLRFVAGWIGLATSGARVDLGQLEAIWHVSPSWGRGVYFDVGSGLALEVERLKLDLPEQSVAASTTRVGLPASGAIGLGFGRWVELELGYQQLLFFNEQPRTAGIAHITLGGRL